MITIFLFHTVLLSSNSFSAMFSQCRVRLCSTAAAARPFDQIPGPKSYPLIGCLHEYFFTKKYSLDRLHWSGLSRYNEYGPIVREEIVPGTNLVYLFDPKVSELFANKPI